MAGSTARQESGRLPALRKDVRLYFPRGRCAPTGVARGLIHLPIAGRLMNE